MNAFWKKSAFLALLGVLGCKHAAQTPLKASAKPIDLKKFMGDWYVVGFIPIDNILVSEADAHDAVESYALQADGSIATTYTFREGSKDGPIRTFHPTGFVHNPHTRTEWRMQFLWPFKSTYLIAYCADDYSATVVGVPDRAHVWLMTRTPHISETLYEELLHQTALLGYDPASVRRVPHHR
jgi:apolipoprotein D and lipocalin family protein